MQGRLGVVVGHAFALNQENAQAVHAARLGALGGAPVPVHRLGEEPLLLAQLTDVDHGQQIPAPCGLQGEGLRVALLRLGIMGLDRLDF